MNQPENKLFVLKDRVTETDDIATFKFSPVHGEIPQFIPGQFVNIYFLDDCCGGQSKSYSISSVLEDEFLNITVKKIGKFSGALHDLKIGEKIKISSPQGRFYPEDKIEKIVFLAGGIGVSPFYSIIKDYFNKKADKDIFLFYSNKTRADAAFLKELDDLSKKWNKLKIVYIFTREPVESQTIKIQTAENSEFERIDINMLKKHLNDLNEKYYFICGSVGFVTGLWKELKGNKVKEEFIRVESFY